MRAPRPAYLPTSLPPSLSLALSSSRRVGSKGSRRRVVCHTAFATLIKRSGLCHTWHAADNSRASVRLRLLPAWPAACVLHPASCLLPPGCCLMPPVIYALNNVAFASSRPSPCRVACAKKMQRSALCCCHDCCCGGMFGMWQPREMRTEHATCSKCHKNIDTSFARPARRSEISRAGGQGQKRRRGRVKTRAKNTPARSGIGGRGRGEGASSCAY